MGHASGPQPNHPFQRPNLFPRGRRSWAWGLGGILVTGGVALGSWAWIYVHRDLAPQISQRLQTSLQRPVQVGDVERVGLSSIRFGPSAIPAQPSATPSSAIDRDNVTIAAIEVGFDLWDILVKRELNLAVTFEQPVVEIYQEPDGTWIETTFKPPDQPDFFEQSRMSLRVRDAQAQIFPHQQAPIRLSQMNGQAQVEGLELNPRFDVDFEGEIGDENRVGGWRVRGAWDSETEDGDLNLQTDNVPLALVNSFLTEDLRQTVQIQQGTLSSNLATTLPLPEADLPDVQGWVKVQGLGGKISSLAQPLKDVTADLQFQGQSVAVNQVRGSLGSLKWQAQGTLNPQAGVQLTAKIDPVNLAQLSREWKLPQDFALNGRVEVANIKITGPLDNPQVQGELRNRGEVQVDQLRLAKLNAPFRGNLARFQVQNLQILPQAGGEVSGTIAIENQGQVVANIQVNQVPATPLLQAYGQATTVELGRVSARIMAQGRLQNLRQLQARVDFQAPEAIYPSFGTALVTAAGIDLPILQTQLIGGVVTGRGQLRDDVWQLALNTTGVPVRQFHRDLSGVLQGDIRLQGSFSNFSPATTQAQAEVALLNSPLGNRATANLAWDGQQIRVNQATAAGITTQGRILAQLTGTPRITGLDLGVQGTNLNLATLSQLGLVQTQLQDVPAGFKLAGLADLTGRLTGTLEQLKFVAQLQTQNLAVNQIQLTPELRGGLRFETTTGLQLALAGGNDRIDLNFAANGWPNQFLIRQRQFQAWGKRQGNILNVNLGQFPLELLNVRLQPQPQPGLISGLAEGQLSLNLADQSGRGSLTIQRPGLANWIGNELMAQFSYGNQTLTLNQGQLLKGNSRYRLQGQIQDLWRAPQLVGQLQVEQGQLADMVALGNLWGLGLSTPAIYTTAAAVQPAPVGERQAPLMVQIRRLAEIQALQAQAKDQRPAAIPQLESLAGEFNAQINLKASARTGLDAGFSLSGQDWQWGQYTIDQVSSSGRFRNQDLFLNQLELQAQGGTITALGQIGPSLANASLRVQNFPLTTLRSLVALPNAPLDGRLNATATLTGTPQNPQLRGQLTLDQARLNSTPITEANATFGYSQGRATFNGQAEIDSPEPLIIAGNIPYQLPFSTTRPASEEIAVTVKVKDEGLSLLNALTDQLSWVEGQGEVNVLVSGTLNQPTVRGRINVANATFSSPNLRGPLTNVTGEIRFNDDRLQVTGLQGLFNQGQVQLSGALPLVQPFGLDDPDRAQPLTLELRQVQVKARDIFTGEVNGDIVITDSLRSPDVGGLVQLRQGQFVLTDALASAGSNPETEANLNALVDPVVFNDFRLQLGEQFQIVRAPVLNFIGQGEITLNGQVDNIQPQGEIRLLQGRLNLFTSLFRLSPDQPNTVSFYPGDGLDPLLNLNLQTTVQEVSSPGTIGFSEINGSNLTTLGSLTPVRIRAQIQGRASQLQTNLRGILQLSSTPGRSDGEILALLGGGFNPNNQGASELALVNLAGSAVFNNIQARIDDFLSDRTTFRLFPALVPPTNNRDSRNNTAVLALGAEVGYQITDNFTLSAVQLLTVPQDPTRLNLGYQLNDQWRLSTQIGLDGESVGLIEFRTRF